MVDAGLAQPNRSKSAQSRQNLWQQCLLHIAREGDFALQLRRLAGGQLQAMPLDRDADLVGKQLHQRPVLHIECADGFVDCFDHTDGFAIDIHQPAWPSACG